MAEGEWGVGPAGRAGRDRRSRRAAARARVAGRPARARHRRRHARAARRVRFVGNRSSGRMGVALAEEARRRGAEVVLLAANLAVAGAARRRGDPDADRRVDARRGARAARRRRRAARCRRRRLPRRPRRSPASARRTTSTWTVELEPTPDIARVARRERKRPGQVLVDLRRRAGGGGPRAEARDARDEERRPGRLQRRRPPRHRLRRRRERGRPGHARRRAHRPEGAEGRDRGRDPRRGREAAWRERRTPTTSSRKARSACGPAWRRRRPCRSRRRKSSSRTRRRSARRSGSPTSASRAGTRRSASSARSSSLSPTDDYAHYALGRALEKQGRTAEANGHYKLASSMEPDPRPTRRASASSVSGERRSCSASRARRSRPGGAIGAGLCILLGVAAGDEDADASRLAGEGREAAHLRERGRQVRPLAPRYRRRGARRQPVHPDRRHAKGNRPSFSGAARPEPPSRSTSAFSRRSARSASRSRPGVFGARMALELENDGPVTIVL